MGEWDGIFSAGRLLHFVSAEGSLHHHMKKSIQFCAVLAVWTPFVQSAQACTVCMGGDGTIGEAANGAIFVMLGVLGAVLGFISVVGYLIVRKGRMPLPPHAELMRSLSAVNVD
jgi:hypothetical protein